MEIASLSGLYDGIRDESFKNLIRTMLTESGISKKYITVLLKDENFSYFSTSFIDVSYDSDNNYFALSSLGHQTLTKSMMWYFIKRYPLLNRVDSKGILSRLKNKHMETKTLAKYMDEHFKVWDYISMEEVTRNYMSNPQKVHLRLEVIQKVLEAMCASIECILDNEYQTIGVGYSIVNGFITYLIESIQISFKHEDLYDRVSVINDLKQTIQNNLNGRIVYNDQEIIDPSTAERTFKVVVVLQRGPQTMIMGEGQAPIKSEAKEIAAKKAYLSLNRMGVYYNVPPIYELLEKNK
jgi:dsRNA-specific ribonuclease